MLKLLIREDEPRNQSVGDEVGERETADFEGSESGDKGASDGGIGEPEEGEIGEDEREELYGCFADKGLAHTGGGEPILACLAHEKADKIDQNSADDGEQGGRTKGGDQQGHGSDDGGLQKDAKDAELEGEGGAVAADFGNLDGDVSFGVVDAFQVGDSFGFDDAGAMMEYGGHEEVHREEGDEGEHEDSHQFTDEVVEPRDWFAENGVEDAVLQIPWDEEGSGGEREDDGEELHQPDGARLPEA